MQNFAWTLRITGNGRKGATAFCRKHKFEVGQPLHFDEEYDQIASLEYVLGALGADLVTGFAVLADKRRLDLDDLEAVVQGHLQNPLIYLGVVGEEGHPGIRSVTIKGLCEFAGTRRIGPSRLGGNVGKVTPVPNVCLGRRPASRIHCYDLNSEVFHNA